MATQVYTFHMAYAGLEERIWRDVEVSSQMRLDQLGYVVLATFETRAYHLFCIKFRGREYHLPEREAPGEALDLAEFTLEDLAPGIGETMEMTYDFGTEQDFLLTLKAKREMKRGEARHFPWVTAMKGRGIIDDLPVWELEELIRQIDTNGKTDEPIYYSADSAALSAPWDVNWEDLKVENALLKTDTAAIGKGYAPFWEDKRRKKRPGNSPSGKAAKPAPGKAEPNGDELCSAFFRAVLGQEPNALRKCFRNDAVIEWPCTNERFNVEDYIRATCEYPGAWAGEVDDVLSAAGQDVMITRVWPTDQSASYHCVSVIRRRGGKIAALTEYWADDGPAPQWRREMGIGKLLRETAQ